MEVNQHFVPDGFVPDGLPDVGEGPSWSKGADASGSVPDVGLTDVGEGPSWSKGADSSGSVPDVGLTDVGDGPVWPSDTGLNEFEDEDPGLAEG